MSRPARIARTALLLACGAVALVVMSALTAPAVPTAPVPSAAPAAPVTPVPHTASALPTVPAAPATPGRLLEPPTGGSVSFLVVDRNSGEIRAERDAHAQYRSASLVKLLIALDYFDSRGPDVQIPPEDRALLGPMLSSSNDHAASILWVRQGWQLIIERMVGRLRLTDTEPPADRRFWGYTATSAADVIRIYDYLLTEAAPTAREFILGALREATQCASDGHDQHFGIPNAVNEPWTVKQGWSGYREREPGQECAEPASVHGAGEPITPGSSPTIREAAIHAQAAEGPDIDLRRHALHTSGTIGADNDTIMVVLSLHAKGTSYEEAATRLTTIARVLYVASRLR